jgi:alkaline phosphatase
MPYDMDRKSDDLELADYVRKGIELLNNRNGFFMAVESGKVDWACHANDAAASIHDVLAFERAIGVAMEFMQKKPRDTLIVVTGDHETGGMSIGFAGTKYSTAFSRIAAQKGSYEQFDATILAEYKKSHSLPAAKLTDLLPTIKDYFGFDYATLPAADKERLERAFVRSLSGDVERAQAEDAYLAYGGYEPLTVTCTHIANQLAGIGWTSYSHTGVPVATFATGRSASLFGGYYDNTDLFFKLAQAMRLKVPARVVAK